MKNLEPAVSSYSHLASRIVAFTPQCSLATTHYFLAASITDIIG